MMEISMTVLESRLGLIKLIKINNSGKKIKMHIVVISPRLQGNKASFQDSRGAFIEVLMEGYGLASWRKITLWGDRHEPKHKVGMSMSHAGIDGLQCPEWLQ